MNQYIDSEKLIELVKEWRSKQMGFAWDAVNEVLKLISALQQERPEVNIWHDVKKEAPTKFGAVIIVLCKNKNKEDGIWLADLIQCFEGQYKPRENWEDPVKWAYLSEILPQHD